MKKLIQGVGINDAGYQVRNGKSLCPYYRRWADMIKRCYSDKFKQSRPTYEGCIVCSEWLTFSNFKLWMEKQDWEGKALDKDLLSFGDPIYSPETCVFMPADLNSLLCGINKKGYCFDKSRGKYLAKISSAGKTINLGRFDLQADAEEAHLLAKKDLLIAAAKNQQDQRIKSALEKRAELI